MYPELNPAERLSAGTTDSNFRIRSLVLAQRSTDFPITKAIYELFQLLGEGKYLACALGVWAMLFLAVTIGMASRMLGARLGALFRI